MAFDNSEFGFERYEVFRLAEEAVQIVLGRKRALYGLPGRIGGQLERAAVSTVAALCEGLSRSSRADRAARFVLARSEATEAAGMARLAQLYRVFPDPEYARLRSTLLSVVRMTTVLAR